MRTVRRLPAVLVTLLVLACSSRPSPGATDAALCGAPTAAEDATCKAFCAAAPVCATEYAGADCTRYCEREFNDRHPCFECVAQHGCAGLDACADVCTPCDDNTCAPGQLCSVHGSCMDRQCTVSTDCACIGSCHLGMCDPPECLSDKDCERYQACQHHDCVDRTCARATDCPTGACDGNTGLCGPAACTDDTGCALGEACYPPYPVPGRTCGAKECVSDADCAAGTHCWGEGCRQ